MGLMKRLGGGQQRQGETSNAGAATRLPAFRRRSKAWAFAVLASIAFLLEAQSEADVFKCITALKAEVLSANDIFEPAQNGQLLPDPWSIRTGIDGRLLITTSELRLELPPLSEASLDRSAASDTGVKAGSFLRPAPAKTKEDAAPATQLKLNLGTILVHAGPRRISLRAGQTRIEARGALFAVSTGLPSGELVSVLKGQVKVHNADKSITFVAAGKSLRTALGTPPQITSLEDIAETLEHKRGLIALEQNTPPFSATGLNAGEVGHGAQTPFDRNERRRDALLTAPNDSNVGRPDVSPELPRNVQSTP